jgi:hypothetical protein
MRIEPATLTASASLRLDANVKIAKPVVATERININSNDLAIVLVTDETGLISKVNILKV